MRKMLVFLSYMCILAKIFFTCSMLFGWSDYFQLDERFDLYLPYYDGLTIQQNLVELLEMSCMLAGLLISMMFGAHPTLALCLLIIWMLIIILLIFGRKNDKALVVLFCLATISAVADIAITSIHSAPFLKYSSAIVNSAIILVHVLTIRSLVTNIKRNQTNYRI